MKKILLAYIILGLNLSIYGQELMTIREVFNFKIGDEFQITNMANGQPPNADRITITGKYYSSDNDTLFYARFHDSYHSSVVWGEEPHLEYYFWTDTDTIYYKKLDSSLLYYDIGFQQNQYIEYSNELCDSLINGCAYESGPGFENNFTRNEYGRGLGKTYAYFYNGSGHEEMWNFRLFYYKKGDLECGDPDMVTVGIQEKNRQEFEFTIYPNPATSFINIKCQTPSDFIQCIITNAQGQIMLSAQLNGDEHRLNINHLESGIYFLQINDGTRLAIKKFIKE